jgi:hypothetical protein
MADPRVKKLTEELVELETRAGIAEKVKDVEIGPLFPNLEATPDEYFNEAADHLRWTVRKLYFELEDVELRKRMIRKRCEIETAAGVYWQRQVVTERRKLAAAQQRAKSLSWFWAGCLAALCVAVGAYYFQLYGSIGGGLMGFFFAQGLLAHERNTKAEEVRTAQEALDELLKSVKEGETNPAMFNANERRSGERDEDFCRPTIRMASATIRMANS